MVMFQIRYQKTVGDFVDNKSFSYTGTAYLLTKKNSALVEKESILRNYVLTLSSDS